MLPTGENLEELISCVVEGGVLNRHRLKFKQDTLKSKLVSAESIWVKANSEHNLEVTPKVQSWDSVNKIMQWSEMADIDNSVYFADPLGLLITHLKMGPDDATIRIPHGKFKVINRSDHDFKIKMGQDVASLLAIVSGHFKKDDPDVKPEVQSLDKEGKVKVKNHGKNLKKLDKHTLETYHLENIDY